MFFFYFTCSSSPKFANFATGRQDSRIARRDFLCVPLPSFTPRGKPRKAQENPGSFGFYGVLGAREGIGLKV